VDAPRMDLSAPLSPPTLACMGQAERLYLLGICSIWIVADRGKRELWRTKVGECQIVSSSFNAAIEQALLALRERPDLWPAAVTS